MLTQVPNARERYNRGLAELPRAGANPTEVMIYNTYLQLLGREPENGAIEWWRNNIATGVVTEQGFIDSVMGSPERANFVAVGGKPMSAGSNANAVAANPVLTSPDVTYKDTETNQEITVVGVGSNREQKTVEVDAGWFEAHAPTTTVQTQQQIAETTTPAVTTNSAATNNTAGSSVTNTSNSVNTISNTAGTGTGNGNTTQNAGNNIVDTDWSWAEIKEQFGIGSIDQKYLWMGAAAVGALILFSGGGSGGGRRKPQGM